MPYVKQERREVISTHGVLFPAEIQNAGELNFAISELLIWYLNARGKNYQTMNDISGAMTEALAEFRRRVVAPYEDAKIQENGDLEYP